MFKQITLAGDSATRGFEHGQQLADDIGTATEIYLSLFARPESEIRQLADRYREVIAAFNPDYIVEIEAIAVV